MGTSKCCSAGVFADGGVWICQKCRLACKLSAEAGSTTAAPSHGPPGWHGGVYDPFGMPLIEALEPVDEPWRVGWFDEHGKLRFQTFADEERALQKIMGLLEIPTIGPCGLGSSTGQWWYWGNGPGGYRLSGEFMGRDLP